MVRHVVAERAEPGGRRAIAILARMVVVSVTGASIPDAWVLAPASRWCAPTPGSTRFLLPSIGVWYRDERWMAPGLGRAQSVSARVEGLPPVLLLAEAVGFDVVREIFAGPSRSRGLRPEGIAFCWCNNQYGTLGDGTQARRLVPAPAATTERFTSLSVGANHACALTAAGEAYCWGMNGSGQVGSTEMGTVVPRPVAVESTERFSAISAGDLHTRARSTDGRALCWGGSVSYTPVPVLP